MTDGLTYLNKDLMAKRVRANLKILLKAERV